MQGCLQGVAELVCTQWHVTCFLSGDLLGCLPHCNARAPVWAESYALCMELVQLVLSRRQFGTVLVNCH